MKIIPHPKIERMMKLISEDEHLYHLYFDCLSIFSKITLKIFPDKE